MLEYRDKISLMKSAQSGNMLSTGEIKERSRTAKTLKLTGSKGSRWSVSLTNEIRDFINYLEDRYYSLDVSRIDNVIDEAAYSSIIEGARITLPESMAVCGRTVSAKTKSEKMVQNTYNAIRYVNDFHYIDEFVVQNIWEKITEDVCDNLEIQGVKYRKDVVVVGSNIKIDYTAPAPEKVQKMMDELFKFIEDSGDGLHPFIKAPIVHFILVYIHPFCDGNGRLSRLLLNDYLIRHRYDKFSKMSLTSAVIEKIDSYYKSILKCEDYEPDLTYFVVYYLNAMERLFDKIENNLKPRRVDDNFSPVQNKTINKLRKDGRRMMTQDSCARDNDITKDQAAKELNDLVDRGYLHKLRKDKVYYKWWDYKF